FGDAGIIARAVLGRSAASHRVPAWAGRDLFRDLARRCRARLRRAGAIRRESHLAPAAVRTSPAALGRYRDGSLGVLVAEWSIARILRRWKSEAFRSGPKRGRDNLSDAE